MYYYEIFSADLSICYLSEVAKNEEELLKRVEKIMHKNGIEHNFSYDDKHFVFKFTTREKNLRKKFYNDGKLIGCYFNRGTKEKKYIIYFNHFSQALNWEQDNYLKDLLNEHRELLSIEEARKREYIL